MNRRDHDDDAPTRRGPPAEKGGSPGNKNEWRSFQRWGCPHRRCPQCATTACRTSPRVPQRSATGSPPATLAPAPTASRLPRIMASRSAFCQERNCPSPARCAASRPASFPGADARSSTKPQSSGRSTRIAPPPITTRLNFRTDGSCCSRFCARVSRRRSCSFPQSQKRPPKPPVSTQTLRSRSSIDTPSGARMKQTRTPGRTVVGSRVNSTPLLLSSAAMASMPFTLRPKWSSPR